MQPKLSKSSKKQARCDPSTSKKTGEPFTTTAPKKRKTVINPITPVMKAATAELFGSESDEEEEGCSTGSTKGTPIYSYVTRKLANGISRQTDDNKTGTHYVELKVYSCNEIKNVAPINRWRHSIITIKNRTNVNSEAWAHLTDYIKTTRKEFKNCPPSFNSTYY